MELLLMFIIPGLIALIQIVLALIAGINLWKQSNLHQPGAARATLRWLAASLIEPPSTMATKAAIASVLIIVRYFRISVP